ncbi:MAG: hypothetical protein KGH98_03255 [Candidatus Micrarchaeota archaeon]|nr:hypothetical protein [Candidatus Micrarchaeota archaeon]
MQKTRPVHISRSTARTRFLEIKCGFTMMPLKSLSYAMQHAKSNREMRAVAKKGQIRICLDEINKSLKALTLNVYWLNRLNELGTDEVYRSIQKASASYVDLFYNMSRSECSAYIKSCEKAMYAGNVDPEDNLLLMPAIMSAHNRPKKDTVMRIAQSLYRMPFAMLYKHSKAAIRVELLQQAMGIKSTPQHVLKELSGSLNRVETLLNAMGPVRVDAQKDGDVMDGFINDVVSLSDSGEMKVAEVLTQKAMHTAVNHLVAKALIRR